MSKNVNEGHKHEAQTFRSNKKKKKETHRHTHTHTDTHTHTHTQRETHMRGGPTMTTTVYLRMYVNRRTTKNCKRRAELERSGEITTLGEEGAGGGGRGVEEERLN